jgi:putative ABC transport system permease protein
VDARVGAATGIGSALVAAWLPAREAVRISPLAAVRAGIDPTTVARWRPRGAAVVAAAARWFCCGRGRFDSPWSGNFAALAADVALVLVAMRAAGPTAALLLRPVRGALGFAGRLAVDRLVRIPDQLALAAAVLALGLGLMLTAATVAKSFEESVLGFIRRQVRADLVVASTAATGWIEAPLDERSPTACAPSRASRASSACGSPSTSTAARASASTRSMRAHSHPSGATTSSSPPATRPAALAAVRAGTGVIVSKNFARQLGVGVGTMLDLDTPSGPLRAPVVGVAVDYVSPRGSIVLSREVYRRRWNDRTANRFHVTLAAGADPVDVRHRIATELGTGAGLKVLTQRELYAYHQDAVHRAFRLTRALELLPSSSRARPRRGAPRRVARPPPGVRAAPRRGRDPRAGGTRRRRRVRGGRRPRARGRARHRRGARAPLGALQLRAPARLGDRLPLRRRRDPACARRGARRERAGGRSCRAPDRAASRARGVCASSEIGTGAC